MQCGSKAPTSRFCVSAFLLDLLLQVAPDGLCSYCKPCSAAPRRPQYDFGSVSVLICCCRWRQTGSAATASRAMRRQGAHRTIVDTCFRLDLLLQVAPDGLCSYCKPCNAAAAAERRAKRFPVVAPTVASKVCSHCQQVRCSDESSSGLESLRRTVRQQIRDLWRQPPSLWPSWRRARGTGKGRATGCFVVSLAQVNMHLLP